MKCADPKPDGTYEECDRDLGHSGDHAYLNRRWPRLTPAEPDWDVQELLDAALPRDAWGVQERSYPVVVIETVAKVIWVDAENQDRALGYYEDDWSDVPLSGADTISADLEFRRPDRFELKEALEARRSGVKVGPLVACPDCGVTAFCREWFHKPLRRCHGPIEWRENSRATSPSWRYRREFRTTPVYDAARQAVTS
ncbi:hypothetical protein [Streptomyces sp. NPDC059994]|uniref:hypothetical protein n=1 Tax=Streptomyces sp. NPDC059994 TaxID=3347029 RepID=UPI0036835620